MSKNFNDDQIKAIHSRLASLRKNTETADQKAISQRELARRTGLTFPRISNLENENDDTEPSIADLLAYRNYFNVSVDYLLCLEDEPTTDVSMKAIYKEYGLSSEALFSLKTLKELDLPFSNSKDLLEVLNVILESEEMFVLLRSLERYFKFYPSPDTGGYAFVSKSLEENLMPEGADAFSFAFDEDKLSFSADEFDEILFKFATAIFTEIKLDSPYYKKGMEEELALRKKEVENFNKNKDSIPYEKLEDEDYKARWAKNRIRILTEKLRK